MKNEWVLAFLIGILSGVVSSIIVTIIYRSKDKKIEVSKYLSQLTEIVEKATYFSVIGADFISDTRISFICEFFEHNILPTTYSWIQLTSEELDASKQAIDLLKSIKDKAHQCQMMSGWLSRDNYPEQGKLQLKNKIIDLKLEIIDDAQRLSSLHTVLIGFNRKYVK